MLKFVSPQNCVFTHCIRKLFFSDVKSELIPRAARLKSELYEKLMLLQPNSPENSKVLKIAVLGCPNSGKSSLVNMLTRWDTCAVSGKVNTTRTKQTAVLTQDNVQLCFVDMPGIIGKRRGLNFKLENSLIRDPHVGIFESDLIICLVDVSHKSSQEELNLELLKALHFFKDKPAILVLNKVDKIQRTMKLFDITKRLTDGVIGGKISHTDSYANRYKKTIPTYYELMEDQKAAKLLSKHAALRMLGEGRESEEETMPCKAGNDDTDNSLVAAHDNEVEELSTSNSHVQKYDDEDKNFLDILNESDDKNHSMNFDFEMDDPILDVLKKQLMMNSSTKEEVAERRRHWREIGNHLENTRETSWKHFQDVFAVSSLTGRGIERLRQYLTDRAVPGSWYFHSSLITDQEPETLVRMCIMANCLNQLEKEIPYAIKIQINNYEKAEDDSLHIHVTLRCKTSRHLMTVLGIRGSNISTIADKSREILERCFQTNVYLKLTAARDGIPADHLRRMKEVNDIKMLYPKSGSG